VHVGVCVYMCMCKWCEQMSKCVCVCMCHVRVRMCSYAVKDVCKRANEQNVNAGCTHVCVCVWYAGVYMLMQGPLCVCNGVCVWCAWMLTPCIDTNTCAHNTHTQMHPSSTHAHICTSMLLPMFSSTFHLHFVQDPHSSKLHLLHFTSQLHYLHNCTTCSTPAVLLALHFCTTCTSHRNCTTCTTSNLLRLHSCSIIPRAQPPYPRSLHSPIQQNDSKPSITCVHA